MGRILLGTAGIGVPGMAAAHPGHLAEVAGHGHWVAGATIGVAILIGLWAGLKGRGKTEAAPDADEAEADPEAA